MELLELLNTYLAHLRVLTIIHKNGHWDSHGANFYGQHLLFERIYDSAIEDLDAAAEKFVGLFDVNVSKSVNILGDLCKKYSSDDHTENSLNAEKDFLKLSEVVYNKLNDANKLSMGCDDMLMSIANNRETAVYLLQQASR